MDEMRKLREHRDEIFNIYDKIMARVTKLRKLWIAYRELLERLRDIMKEG